MLLLANINDYIEITKMIVKISHKSAVFLRYKQKKEVVMRPPLLGVKAFGLA